MAEQAARLLPATWWVAPDCGPRPWSVFLCPLVLRMTEYWPARLALHLGQHNPVNLRSDLHPWPGPAEASGAGPATPSHEARSGTQAPAASRAQRRAQPPTRLHEGPPANLKLPARLP